MATITGEKYRPIQKIYREPTADEQDLRLFSSKMMFGDTE